jgi:hypothetical protein
MANRKTNDPKDHFTLRLTQVAQTYCEAQAERVGLKSGRVWAQEHIEKLAHDAKKKTPIQLTKPTADQVTPRFKKSGK